MSPGPRRASPQDFDGGAHAPLGHFFRDLWVSRGRGDATSGSGEGLSRRAHSHPSTGPAESTNRRGKSSTWCALPSETEDALWLGTSEPMLEPPCHTRMRALGAVAEDGARVRRFLFPRIVLCTRAWPSACFFLSFPRPSERKSL